MGDLILVSDDDLNEDDLDILSSRFCDFEQEVPVEWEMGGLGKNIICSACWLEDRWDEREAEKKAAAKRPPQPPVARKGQLSLFDKS